MIILTGISLIAQQFAEGTGVKTAVPIGVFVIIGVIAILVTLALVLSPKGSRRSRRRNGIFNI